MDYRVLSLDSKEVPGRLDEFIPEVERENHAEGYLEDASWWDHRAEGPGTYPSSNTLPAKMPRLIRNFDLHGNGATAARYGVGKETIYSKEVAYPMGCERKPPIPTAGTISQREEMRKPNVVSLFAQVY